jgi:16S rRNA C967 or C1407 C5-methylase (RsmB/RsmF family)
LFIIARFCSLALFDLTILGLPLASVDDLNIKFNFILLDAPCSGNFCVESNFFQERSVLLGVKERSRLQKDLLKSAWRALLPGGILVYSTCSLEPEEDELVIDWFLGEKENAKLLPINVSIGDDGYTTVFDKELRKDISLSKRFWPHKTQTGGFFIAKLQKLKE